MVMTRDPMRDARARITQAENRLSQVKAEHELAKRVYDAMSKWKFYRRWELHTELEDLSFKMTHAAMDVVRAKAAAWDTQERLSL
jgi:hypothetical protein